MSSNINRICLDTNVLIQAWQKYYSPKICPDYWSVLNELGDRVAHAINENAIVVTKEEKVTAANTNRIKIPNVCDNMGIPWINDFELIERLNIRFSCGIVTK